MLSISAEKWRTLSKYLDEVLELDDSALHGWFASLRGRDPAMADQVAQILEGRKHDGYRDFLANVPAAVRENAAGTLVGRRVGPYLIDAEIGRGGMGSVWRAHRTDGRYEGKVAVKFVHAAWIGGAGEQRFRLEGNLLGRLDHPNIARLLDAGVLDGTQPYLIIEYIEGESIDTYCERHKLGVEARVGLFLEVLDAVGHAHSHLIVHRDIKPANIFVTESGTVKLLDFGIAKLLEGGADPSALTHSSAMALTPQYAAPEQLLGQPVSTVTDVYCLGLVLYVLLTGSSPIPANSQSRADLLHAVVNGVPPPASTVAGIPAVAGRALEGDLDNILHKALKKGPAERYGSVGALADDLKRFLTHQPVQARPDTLRYRTQKFVQRHRGGVTAALLIVTAVLTGFIGTVWQAHRAEVNARLADRARQRALADLSYAEASNEFLSFLLETGSGKPFTTPELLARGEGIVNGQFRDDPGLRAGLLYTLADLYAQVEDKAKALSLFLEAQSAARAAGDEALILVIDCSVAMEYADQNDFAKAFPLLDASIRRARTDSELDPAVLAGCLDNRSQTFRASGDGPAALVDAREAVATLGTPRTGQRTLALSTQTTLASANAMLGHSAAAAMEYQKAVEELTRMGRGQSDFAVTLLNSQGVILAKSGQCLQAAEVYESALGIARAVSGGGEISPMTQINYAKLLIDLGRERESLPNFDAALGSARNRDDRKAEEMVNLLSAPAWCALGKLDECSARLDRSGESLRKRLPPGHTTLGTQETEEAQLAFARGQPDKAQEHLGRALQIFAAASERSPNELRALTMQTELDLSQGRISVAGDHAKQAVAKAQAALGGFSGSVWLGRALLVQAEVLRASGELSAAKTTARRAVEMLHATIGDEAPWTREARAALAELATATT